MKSEINRMLRHATVFVLGILLCGSQPLSAQETNDAATNVVAETNTIVQALEGTNDAAPAQTWQPPSRRGEPMVVIGNDAELAADDDRESVVAVFGNVLIKGKTWDAVAVLGNVTSSGTIRDSLVAVMGNVRVSGEAHDVVAVLGNVDLEDGAVIKGDVVSVGGKVNRSPNARVDGDIINPVDFGGLGLPHLDWLKDWMLHCVLKFRPLAPQVGWVWAVAGVFLLFYALVAVTLPKPVQSCVGELTRRPITSFFLGVITLPLAFIVCLILAATGIGLIVVVFLLPALLFAGLLGKVALLEYLGDSIRRATGAANPFAPLVAMLVGAVLLTVLYLIPILGLLTFAVTGLWGLGAAVSATFGGMKREMPEKPAPPSAMPPGGATQAGFAPAPMPVAPTEATAGFTANPESATPSEGNPATQGFAASTPPPGSLPLAVPDALAFPRAGFFERMGAAFLDIVIVSILVGVVANIGFGLFHRPPFGLLVALAYFAGMWTWKGTTVGGIILNLKVVRLDNQPVTFVVALVRGLSAALSVMVLFLGFLWIAWDKDKQGWHDRIAGTVVVRLPRGTPLVVL